MYTGMTRSEIEKAEGKRVKVTDSYGKVYEGTCHILSLWSYDVTLSDKTTKRLRIGALIAGQDKLEIEP